MKVLKKLALATAVATMATSSFALEQLDDATLANTTAQDGITITITPDETVGVQVDELYIHDNDGLADSTTFNYNGETINLGGTGKSGAVLVNGLNIKGDTGSNIAVTVDTDAGAGGSDPFINANVAMNGKTTIKMDSVQVIASGSTKTAYNGTANGVRQGTGDAKNILGGLELSLTDASMNVQMGAQPQGAMVLMNAKLTGGLNIKNLEVIDADGHSPKVSGTATPSAGALGKGGLLVKDIVLTDTGSENMTLAQKIDIDGNKGIVITMNSPDTGYYGYMTDVGFSNGEAEGVFGNVGTGTANNILGDVEIVGLKMGNSTISISGH